MTQSLIQLLPEPEPKKSLWQSARYSNLRRYIPSGVYYAHAKVGGVLVRQSLKTTDIDVAKIRLDKLLISERSRLSKKLKVSGKWSFGKLAELWKERLESKQDLKRGAKLYRNETLKTILGTPTIEVERNVTRRTWLRHYFPHNARKENPLPREVKFVAIKKQVGGVTSLWPGLSELPVSSITHEECLEFMGRLRKKYSSSRYNGCLQTLRSVFALGVKIGLIAENPTAGIESASLKQKAKHLPEDYQFDKLLERLAALPSRRSALLTVKFLAYSGRRIGSARKLYPKHVNLKRGTILWPPIKYQEDFQEVPMIPQLRKVVEELLEVHPQDGSPLLPIAEPRVALATCCREAGIPRLTNHDFRHTFTTKALEQGIPVPDVAMMRGDKDGGAMLLKNYFHSRIEHLTKVAKKIKF